MNQFKEDLKRLAKQVYEISKKYDNGHVSGFCCDGEFALAYHTDKLGIRTEHRYWGEENES